MIWLYLPLDYPRSDTPTIAQSGEHHESAGTAVSNSAHKRTIFTPLNLGPPSCKCRYCGSFFWPPPEPLYSLLIGANPSLSNHFFENIRYYNSMFAFISMGVKVMDSINDGRGPHIFKISGQLCHRIGSLLPQAAKRPEYAQLYIFDTQNEIRYRMQVATYENSTFQPNQEIVSGLIEMLNEHNPIVKLFRMARDRLSSNTDDRYCIRIFGTPDKHGDIFSAPVASEVH
ncbi:hypothetical protein EJB05_57351, partial [Eragrostis curvula]